MANKPPTLTDAFNNLHSRWRTAMDSEGVDFDPTLIDEAAALAERVLTETTPADQPAAPAQYPLISALAHYDLVCENRDEDEDDDEDLIDAADALVSELNDLLHH